MRTDAEDAKNALPYSNTFLDRRLVSSRNNFHLLLVLSKRKNRLVKEVRFILVSSSAQDSSNVLMR